MPIPVTLEGQKRFASLPTLPDFRNFRDFLQANRRKAAYAAIPLGIPDADFKRWLRTIDEECRSIDPFKSFTDLASTNDGLALLFHAMLRHDNQGVTLSDCLGMVERAEAGRAESVEAVREMRTAIDLLLAAKKNEGAPPKDPGEEPASDQATASQETTKPLPTSNESPPA